MLVKSSLYKQVLLLAVLPFIALGDPFILTVKIHACSSKILSALTIHETLS